MICAKCGTEYEGSQCPKCNGPVIKINNSDYLARRKAYEEKQAKLKEREALLKEEQAQADSDNDNAGQAGYEPGSNQKNNKTEKTNRKTHAPKSKNYDEGVFDITKVDLNQVADKLKNGKDAFVDSKDRFAKSLEEKAKDIRKTETGRNSKRSSGKSGIPYTKVGVAAAVILILIAAVVLIVNIVTRKNYNIYMSDGNKIYDVSSLDSKYVCDKSSAIFALDDDTFFTPEWPVDIDKNNSVLNVASPKGSYFATDVYDATAGMYTLYIWSDNVCLKAAENIYEHNVYYISDKGTVIYEETETINDNGKTGVRMLSMAEVKKDKSQPSGYVCEAATIERNLNSAYVYSSKDIIVILNTDGRLYQYDFVRKTTTEVDLYVDNVSALGSSTDMYMPGAEHLNTTDDADSYMYSVSGNNYYVETKNAKATQLKGVNGANITYIYDKKNNYLYWLSNKKISYAKFKDGEISDIAVLENTGNNMNMIYLTDTQELVYVNDASQLVKAEKGKKTFIKENVKDGSLSVVKNTDVSLTYVSDGKQYYIKNTSASPVAMCDAGELVNTSNTGFYKKSLYYYGADGQLYTCNLKGGSQNVIGNVERFFVGNYIK